MSLAQALKANAAAVQDSTDSYQQDVLDVSNLMTSVMASTLPNLYIMPANWKEIVTAYEQARKDALDWTNQVYAQLMSTPDDVATYNEAITAAFDDAIAQAQILIDDPNNQAAKSTLTADLKAIQNLLSLVNIFIEGCLNSVNRFGDTVLPDAAKELTAVANDAYEDVQIDQAAIDEYKKEIAELNKEIQGLAAEIGINATAIAVELTVGTIFFDLGGALLIGAAVAGEATVIGLDVQKLIEDKAKLNELQTSPSISF